MSKYHHIILFRIKDGVSDDVHQKALIALRKLGQGHPGLETWQVHESIDTRKGQILIQEGVFATEEDFKRFQDSEIHAEVGNIMKEIADWWIGDYLAPSA